MGTKIKDLSRATSFKPSDIIPITDGNQTRGLPMSVLVPNTAAAHNNFIRGKVLTDEYSLADILSMVAARDYHDIFAGDKIRVNVPAIAAVKDGSDEIYAGFAGGLTEFLVAEIESHWNYGDSTPLNKGHLCLVPSGTLGNSKMNATHITEGAYAGSKMHTKTMPAVQTALESAFGAAHVLAAREHLTNTVNTTQASKAALGLMGCSTAGSWQDCKVRLMTELEVYGDDVWSSSAFDSLSGLSHQLAVFRMDGGAIINRANWWLSAVCYSTTFCCVSGYGAAGDASAGGSGGVRPRFIIG